MSDAAEREILRTMRTLWASIFATPALLLVALFWKGLRTPAEPPIEVLFPALAFAAVSAAVASFVIPAILFRNQLQKLQVPLREAEDPKGIPGFAQKVRVVADPGAARVSVLRAYQQPMILGLALSEAVALFGFVLAFQGFPLFACVPFFIVSLVLIALRFPMSSRILRRFEAVRGVSL